MSSRQYIYSFRPGLITSLLAVVFFVLFIRLGIWQLDRAEYKATKHQTFMENQQLEAIDMENLDNENSIDDLVWRNVSITGQFKNEIQILLDNQVHKSQAGYYIYTPFVYGDEEKVILVNRGWLLSPLDRSTIPELNFSSEIITLKGQLKKEPLTGIYFNELPLETMQQGVYRSYKINIKEIESSTGLKLFPLIIRLDPESPLGYTRDWRLPGSDEAKHLGYAYQWFAFATVLLVIYILLNLKKKR